MPEVPGNVRRILDVGCGGGQTLAGLKLSPQVLAIGVDRDFEALKLGKELAPGVQFVCAKGESLPFRDQSFDFVISRLALPYMNVPAALREMARVMTLDGKSWIVLNTTNVVCENIGKTIRERNPRACLFELYALLNGVLFHVTGTIVRCPFSGGRYASFQTCGRISKILRLCGFNAVKMSRGKHLIVIAEKATPHNPS